MFSVGQKIIYGESGVCTVERIAPLEMSGASAERMYYYLSPLIGSGTYFAPVDSGTFMRELMDRSTADALICSIPSIEPAVCLDSRFNHVDAFYKDQFKKHTPEALVAIIKGLKIRMTEKKTKSSRAEATMKRAKETLYGELSIVLDMEYNEVENYILSKIGEL